MNDKLLSENPEHFIDITREVCPMTFVKTKLAIEKLPDGEVLLVRLKGAEPLNNVPRSAADNGHEVLSIEPESADQAADGIHLLRIQKNG